MTATMDEHIVIIGAGITGCLTAICLHTVGYRNVTLLDKNRGVCGETTGTVSEMHCGAEYPTDLPSGIACLHGAIAFRRMLPVDVFGEREPTRFLISKPTEARGEITVERFAQTMTALQAEYVRMIERDPLNEVFGPPGAFWRRLEPDEHREVAGVAGGFLTPQRGLNPVRLAAVLDGALKESSVVRRFGCEVQGLVRRGWGFAVTARREGVLETLPADMVVIAANHWGFQLAARVAGGDYRMPTVYAALREIVLVDRSATGHDARASNFMLEGDHGAMEGGVTPGLSFVYCPRYSQIAKIPLDPRNLRIPADWEERLHRPSSEDVQRGRQILQGAVRNSYGYLAGAKLVSTHVKVAINSVESSRQRRNPKLDIPTLGCVNASFVTKATTAPLKALEVTRELLETSVRRGRLAAFEQRRALQRLETMTIRLPRTLVDSTRRTSIHAEVAQLLGLHPGLGLAHNGTRAG